MPCSLSVSASITRLSGCTKSDSSTKAFLPRICSSRCYISDMGWTGGGGMRECRLNLKKKVELNIIDWCIQRTESRRSMIVLRALSLQKGVRID